MTKDPRVAPPAGVNHAGRRAKFTWSEEAVAQLLRIIEHTEARIVITSKVRECVSALARNCFVPALLGCALPCPAID